MGIKIIGVVVGGNRIGRTLGFPTANMVIERELDLRDGVYAVHVQIEGELHQGMANLGYRPSISEDRKSRVLEINIFNFDRDIYGEQIEVELVEFIREELKFDSLEQLKKEVDRDRWRIEAFFRDGMEDSLRLTKK